MERYDPCFKRPWKWEREVCDLHARFTLILVFYMLFGFLSLLLLSGIKENSSYHIDTDWAAVIPLPGLIIFFFFPFIKETISEIYCLLWNRKERKKVKERDDFIQLIKERKESLEYLKNFKKSLKSKI